MTMEKTVSKHRRDVDADIAAIEALRGSCPPVRILSKQERDKLAEEFFRRKGL
mgnify:FL=1